MMVDPVRNGSIQFAHGAVDSDVNQSNSLP